MDGGTVLLVVVLLFVLLVVVSVVKAVQIIPQAQAAVIERLGRYQRHPTPGWRSSCRSSTASATGSTCASRWCRSRRSR